jgi:HEAT repeat protein
MTDSPLSGLEPGLGGDLSPRLTGNEPELGGALRQVDLPEVLRTILSANTERTVSWRTRKVAHQADFYGRVLAHVAYPGALRRDAIGRWQPYTLKQRGNALIALGTLQTKEAIGVLGIVLVNDRVAELRQLAAWALGEMESVRAIPWLVYALSDRNVHVRRQAAQALGTLASHVWPSTRQMQAIEIALTTRYEANNEDFRVRREAGEALACVRTYLNAESST